MAFRSKLECMMLGAGTTTAPGHPPQNSVSSMGMAALDPVPEGLPAGSGVQSSTTPYEEPRPMSAATDMTSSSAFASAEMSPATPLTLVNGTHEESTPLRPPNRRVPPPRRQGVHHATRRAHHVSVMVGKEARSDRKDIARGFTCDNAPFFSD